MWIENVSFADVERGFHYDAGPNSMLIQIVDPAMAFPTPKYNFKQVHRYEFLDADTGDGYDEFVISDEQAQQIADNLVHAYANHMNVIVHCVAGVCRSGAVAEVGVILGFQDTEKYRQPNITVKRKLLEQLGFLQK